MLWSGTTGDENTKNLSFTVIGQYVGIIDFVSAIENDSELGFRIENFNLIPDNTTTAEDANKTQEELEKERANRLKATFSVTGIRIKIEQTTQTVDGTTSSEDTTNEDGTNSADTTNSVGTTNTVGAQNSNTANSATQVN